MAVTEHDPVDLEANEQAAAEGRQRAKRAEDQLGNDFVWLASSVRGRRILWWLLSEASVFRSTFHPTATVMAVREGERNIGLKVLDLLNRNCPDQYQAIVREGTAADQATKPRDDDRNQARSS